MRHLRRLSALILFVVSATGSVQADDKLDLKTLLARPVLEPQQTLKEVQEFCASRIPPLPAPSSPTDWEKAAERLREETLARTVYRGDAAKWRDANVGVEWLETISGGPGYRIKKLRYEAVPGMWIPALLYEPEKLTGKVPVFLNVNGHDPVGKAAEYKQMRCINQAKRGILALNVEWFGMGQLRTDGFSHARMNQLDLCGTSGLAPFFLSMKRGIDLLLSLENADPSRVGVAGLSGGGWQTIYISALDPRVTLSNPVAGYSSFITRGKNFSDLGDSEQTPVDLGTIADYSHLTALRAPRPTLLTYNLNDNCCFKADHALPPLLEAARPFFRLYGKDDNLRYHVNAEPGDHNFQKENREALYQMIGLHFFPHDRAFNPTELPSEKELKTADELRVALPEKNADFQVLALGAAGSLPRDPELPTDAESARKWQAERRAKLREVLRIGTGNSIDAKVHAETSGESDALYWSVTREGMTVPVVSLTRGKSPSESVIVIAEEGRTAALEPIGGLLASGKRVLACDPFYFGEAKINQRDYLFGLLVSAVGARPLGIQADQVLAVARGAAQMHGKGPVTIAAHGPRMSLIALAAAALDSNDAIARVELHGSFGSLKEIIEQNREVSAAPELFTFGLLERFDVRQLVALVAPRPVMFHGASERARQELGALKTFYKVLGRDFSPVE